MEGWQEGTILRSGDMVWRLAGRELVSWGGLGRDDLYQEGMVGLILALRRYDPKKNDDPLKFSWKRIRGAMIDAKRNYSYYNRSKNVEGDRAPSVVNIQDECYRKNVDCNLTINPFEIKDLLIDLEMCVEKLPVGQREAIKLIFYRGLSFSETSSVLKITREAVWLRVNIALRILRKWMA